jgi:predicted MFS family arabinose efflux permease
VAVVELGWSLSFVIGVPLMAFLIARSGWTSPFPWLAGLSLISLTVVVWILPNSTNPLHESHFLVNIRRILGYPPAVAGLLFGGLISAGNEIINLIFGVWLEESFGLKAVALGAASLVIGLSELMGESLVGGITDRLEKKRAIGGGLLLNTAFALLLPFLGKTLPGALIGLFLFFITFEFTLVSSIPLMTEITPSSRATLLSVNVAGLSLGRAMAALLAPRIFVWGIFASILAAVGFNLLALMALRKLRFPY